MELLGQIPSLPGSRSHAGPRRTSPHSENQNMTPDETENLRTSQWPSEFMLCVADCLHRGCLIGLVFGGLD